MWGQNKVVCPRGGGGSKTLNSSWGWSVYKNVSVNLWCMNFSIWLKYSYVYMMNKILKLF